MSGKGSNSVKLRQYNERFVLDAIRRLREASKSDLARAANLTPAAVADIVDGLEAAGFVKQVGKRFGQRGSPSVLYRLNPERVFGIGIKIGRRALEAVLVDFAGEVRARQEHEYAFPDPDTVRRAGNSAVAAFVRKVGQVSGATVAGLGIASPYFLGGWSEEEIVTAIQTGVRPDGRILAPIMPWRALAGLTKDDALAVAAYLKSIPPVVHKAPGPFGASEKPSVFVMRLVPP